MSNVGVWDVAAASNQLAVPDGFPEGQSKPSLNNSSREVMAAVARVYRDLEWGDYWASPASDGMTFTLSKQSDTVIRIVASPASDQTAYFSTNRRIKITSGGSPVYGYVVSTDYGTPPNNDITVVMDGGVEVPASPTGIYVYVLESIRKAAFSHVTPLATGRHTISLPAAALTPAKTYGCDPYDTWETTAGRSDIKGLGFPDSLPATGVIQVDDYSTLSNGVDTLTIDGTVYTFRTAYSTDGDIEISVTSNADQATIIASRLNASALGTTSDCTYAANGPVVTVTHDTPGVAGNAFTLSTNADTEISVSSGTLGGGSDATRAQITIPAPKSWDGGDLQLLLAGCHVGATGTTVRLRARAKCVGDGVSYDTAYGTQQDFSDLVLATAEMREETGELPTALTPGGTPTDNCDIDIEIERDPTHANDNLDSLFILTSIRIFATTDAANDA